MFYVKVQTQEHPKTEADIRAEFPNTSFPSPIPEGTAQEFGYEKFEYTNPPSVDKYKKVTSNGIEKNELGIWVTAWAIVDMTDVEKAKVDADKATEVRLERNQKLSNSDWTQFDDVATDKAAWLIYRQALRDVPQQSGFPHNVIWPTKPE